MRVIKLRDFVFQNYYKWVEFSKDLFNESPEETISEIVYT